MLGTKSFNIELVLWWLNFEAIGSNPGAGFDWRRFGRVCILMSSCMLTDRLTLDRYRSCSAQDVGVSNKPQLSISFRPVSLLVKDANVSMPCGVSAPLAGCLWLLVLGVACRFAFLTSALGLPGAGLTSDPKTSAGKCEDAAGQKMLSPRRRQTRSQTAASGASVKSFAKRLPIP